jgi:hypothetical protein
MTQWIWLYNVFILEVQWLFLGLNDPMDMVVYCIYPEVQWLFLGLTDPMDMVVKSILIRKLSNLAN